MKRVLICTLLAAATLAAPAAAQSPPDVMRGYAADTWRSFEAMTDEGTGLPSDNVKDTGERAGYTSPTNIAAYLWSTIAARDLGFIGEGEARTRLAQTLTTLGRMERHEASGQYFNWYSPSTTEKLTVWPVDGSPVDPFLSSVDNGWLAAGLMMVERAEPALAAKARALYEPMDFGFYYDPGPGQLRGGAWDDPGTRPCDVPKESAPGETDYFTCHHYGSLNTEPRIASYIGIARGQVPEQHYFRLFRTFPSSDDWGWQEQRPDGVTRTYEGVDVYEGHYAYRGMNIVPSWGGSMFEALMVPLLVPEEQWAPRSWGVNHPLYVQAQIEHGMQEAGYGFWGFSPSNKPEGGYSEYGVDAIGLNPDGYSSNNDKTTVDYGFGDVRPAESDPPPSAYTNGVVTPHAAFLALDFDCRSALDNLSRLRARFDIYGDGGFYDAVNVQTGAVSRYHLSLDQGMIMAALTNELTGDRLQRYFSDGQVEASIRPLIGQEEFTAGGGAPPDAECARDQPAPGPGAAGPGAAGPAAIDRRVWISRRTVRIDRRRRGRVRLFCGPSTATRCRGVLQMVRAGKLTYARRSIAAPAGRKHWVRIRLNRSSYRTLVKKRRARVLIELHTRGSDGVLRRGAVRTTVALARRR
jgi:hypothetical protein